MREKSPFAPEMIRVADGAETPDTAAECKYDVC